MKKKAFSRGLLGFPLGIAIGHVLSVIVSLNLGYGTFQPCTPGFISFVGSEINAVVLQTLLYGVAGTSFAASTVVWEMERWSIVKQTGVYFFINGLVTLSAAYLLGWMEHSVMGFIRYFGLFTLYFALIWGIQYFAWKRAVKRMNAKLRRIQEEENTL